MSLLATNPNADSPGTVAPTLQLLLNASNKPLKYSVVRASSYSGAYHPNNILHNRPHDMYSRWSGSSQHAQSATSGSSSYIQPLSSSSSSSTTSSPAASAKKPDSSTVIVNPSLQHPQKQYIILKLDRPSVVKSITFGKYHKPHPCNLRDFKVFGSNNLESLLPSNGSNSQPPAVKRLVRGSLKNDSTPETYEFRWLQDVGGASSSNASFTDVNLTSGEGQLDRKSIGALLLSNPNAVPFAIRYVKIVPLAAHTANYNFSIWHVALAGVVDSTLVNRVVNEYQQYRESTTIRLILKHLRQQGHHSAHSALLQSSRLEALIPSESTSGALKAASNPLKRPFEHPLLTSLFDALVKRGAWEEVEAYLERAAFPQRSSGVSTPISPIPNLSSQPIALNLASSACWSSTSSQSMFSNYIAKQMPKAYWAQILPLCHHQIQHRDSSGHIQSLSPSGRGGHSMVFDSERGIAYLFGGWDGTQDLADLWSFHVHENRWRLISRDTRLQGGPGPRSCHKMCLDEKSGCIYLLGRYIDNDHQARPPVDPVGSHSTRLSSSSPSSSTRTTRATFLARAPETDFSTTSDVSMGATDASSQTGRDDANANPPVSTTSPTNQAPRAEPATGGSNNSNSNGSSQARMTSLNGVSGVSRYSMRVARSSNRSRSCQPLLASPPGREADFYRFSTRSERWERLSADTFSDGGPKLIYDHGLVADPQNQMLYIFGGRVADPDPSKFEFSGMWRYDIIQRGWTFLFDDNTAGVAKILSRSGHSMLLDPGKPAASGISPSHTRQIWILGGQRGAAATYLADMYTYNLATGAVKEISRNTAQNGPESGFTQRATIDVAAREISLFVGLIGARGERKRSAFWIYNIPRGSWKKVYEYEAGLSSEFSTEAAAATETFGMELDGGQTTSSHCDQDGDLDGEGIPELGPLQALPSYADDISVDEEDMGIEAPSDSWTQYPSASAPDVLIDQQSNNSLAESSSGTPSLGTSFASTIKMRSGVHFEPRPRYAAQMAYDDRRKVYYLHGGNPEDPQDRNLRLDDLWKLTLLRPTPGEILRRAKFRVRRQRFLEMTQSIACQLQMMTEAQEGQSPLEASPRVELDALMYLQSEVGAVVDHSDEVESKMFRKLMAYLLGAETTAAANHHMNRSTTQDSLAEEAGEGSLRTLAASASLLSSGDRSGAAAGRPSALSGSDLGSVGSPSPAGSESWSVGAKRAREEIEPEEDELEGSVSSLMSGGDADSEMLSASQILPSRAKKASVIGAGLMTSSGITDLVSGTTSDTIKVKEDEGRPSALYTERTRLFRSLLEYFNPEFVEPRAEVGACIELALGS